MRYLDDQGGCIITGAVLEMDPPRRLVTTFQFLGPEFAEDAPSRVTWEIAPLGDVCKLALLHEFDQESATFRSVRFGWNPVLSGLKTLLETGEH